MCYILRAIERLFYINQPKALSATQCFLFCVRIVFCMPYKIISPTGNSIIKTLSDEMVESLKRDKYFTLVSMQPRVFVGGSTCTSCEG